MTVGASADPTGRPADAAAFIKTPTRRTRSPGCARAESGHAAAEPPMTLMKSRRRIALSRHRNHAFGHQSRKFRPAEQGANDQFALQKSVTRKWSKWVITGGPDRDQGRAYVRCYFR